MITGIVVWPQTRKSIIHNGYVMIYYPSHPFSGSNGYVKQHRIIVEKHIGRILDRDEVVHHKNGNKLDNRLENLEIMSREKHTSLHNKGKHLSVEHRKKIGKAHKDNKYWQGRRHNKETIEKMRKARLRYWKKKNGKE